LPSVSETVRRSAIAGAWYPDTAASIAAEVEQYLEAARPLAEVGNLRALISPHAGLRYSGPVAAFGYSLLRGRETGTVVIVGPSHRFAFEGSAVFTRGAFETPLGRAGIDTDLADALVAASPGVRADERPHEQEHSLEMQLPFLQLLVPELRIVPVLMGTQSREDVETLAEALAVALAGRQALLVASSDLSHYLSRVNARDVDSTVVSDLADFSPERLMDRLERRRNHACGGGPMVAVMRAARTLGADTSAVLSYADSGDAGEHDTTRVVGYVSAALFRSAA
jgi:AmmeMemoRadiSam system protein B